jgi:hypothetical protein
VLVTLTKASGAVAYSLQFGAAKRKDIQAHTLENNFWSTKLKVFKMKEGIFKGEVNKKDVEENELTTFLGLCYFGSNKKLRILIVEKAPGKADIHKSGVFTHSRQYEACTMIVASVNLLKQDNPKLDQAASNCRVM